MANELGDIKVTPKGKYIWHACEKCGKERWVWLLIGRPRNLHCNRCSHVWPKIQCSICGKDAQYKTKKLCRKCYSKIGSRLYYLKNRERCDKAQKKYRLEHPSYDAKSKRDCGHRRRAVLNGYTKFNLDDIALRDRMICGICHKKVKGDDLHFDHIIPISCGGAHIPSNVQVSHATCNLRKGPGRLPSQIRMEVY